MTPQDPQIELIDRLAIEIAQHIPPRIIPIAHRLWTYAEIAHYLRLETSYVQQHMPHAPGFPAPIRLVIRKGSLSHPRFRAVEVIRWAEAQRDKP